jgi:hypothetical protein
MDVDYISGKKGGKKGGKITKCGKEQKGKGMVKGDVKQKCAKKGRAEIEGWCDSCGKWGRKKSNVLVPYGQQQTVATVGAEKSPAASKPPGLGGIEFTSAE